MSTRVLTIGTFDLFHEGHKKILGRAAALGDELFVGVNSDDFVETYKRPTFETQERRLENVRGEDCVSYAVINDGPGADLIRWVRPDLLVVGSDWHDSYLPQINMSYNEIFVELQCGIVYLPRTPDVSSTELRS